MSSLFKELTDESFELEATAGTIQYGRRIGMPKAEVRRFVARYHHWFCRCREHLPQDLLSLFEAEYKGGLFNRVPKIKSFLDAPTAKKDYYYGEDPDGSWENPYSAFQQRLLMQRWILLHAEDRLCGNSPVEGQERPQVFVVHGHSEDYLRACTELLHRLRLRPVVLRNEPSQGRTIIEKFEDYSDVHFAVVLLTADDVGSIADREDKDWRYRARQNVIFELGFFIGRLGRNHVCALHQHDVEILSDYQGVVYTPLDDLGRWRLDLTREMRATGLPVLLSNIYGQS